jgi:hypothetical protein
MKKQMLLLVTAALISAAANSQCTPDTVSCRDILEPGQICPEVLADGYVGIPYSETVTIWPPSSATINNITVIIVSIRIDTVTNLPPGLVYEMNATKMFPGTAYCVLTSGVPAQAGEYKLKIRVVPSINLLGDIIELPPVENDTSVRITVYGSDAIEGQTGEAFHTIANRPNPFSETTSIGFLMEESAAVSLHVFNNLGIQVYSETMQAKPGRNFFRFTGESIGPGHYIYSIVNKQSVYSGKMIKTSLEKH